MTQREIRPPVLAIDCDKRNPHCPQRVTGGSWYEVRSKARRAGWMLRPARGKGSRTAPDYCPEHAEDGA